MTRIQDPYFQVWLGLGGLLLFSTAAGYLYDRWRPSPETRNTLLRIRTWWLIVLVLLISMSAGAWGIAALLAFTWVFSGVEIAAAVRGASAPRLIPALLVSAFITAGLVHVGLLAKLESAWHRDYPWLFFLILVTSLNDVAQYLWGKSIGGPRIVPGLSPGKTWAGFIGGIVTSSFLAAMLSQWLVSLPLATGAAAGLLIGAGGFAGDVAVSAFKRSVGRKNSGTLLPGHGGILDRIDSLCLTAPLFYWFAKFKAFC